jgi:prepilin-type N-terminal cleavage/methylation domain-containing protein
MRRQRQRSVGPKASGFALIELLVAMAITGLLALALTFAFTAEVNMQRLQETRRVDQNQTDSMEREITRAVQGAKLLSTATDTTTYFQGTEDNGTSDLGCDRLTLTTTAPGIPMAAMLNTTDDFETQQQARGPVGGVSEISFGTTAVGDAADKTGLFERMQRPSDSDPTQGGFETVLDSQIDRIGFEFWDGQKWVNSWDTTTGIRRLPQAVQVSYTLKNGTDSDIRIFVVPIPASDVTPQNPVSTVGAT